MTVITKPLSEKKIDILGQPLVSAECLPHVDVEGGQSQGQHADPRLLILQARARRASSVTTACLLLMALLVMCCGVLGGVYLYKQYAYTQSGISKYQAEFRRKQKMARDLEMSKQIEQNQQFEAFLKMHRFKGWCAVPFESIGVSSPLSDNQLKKYYVNEEFDIDGGLEDYEKITVPDVDGLRSSRFIHDFNANKTGILDMERKRCFVMALNRSQVLPPRDLIDLLQKMWQGYYEVDVHTVHETMRAVLPPVKDSSVGQYIQRECQGYPIYKLEKFVSGVFKRSIAETGPEMFKQFTGKKITEVVIMNLDEIQQYEQNSIST